MEASTGYRRGYVDGLFHIFHLSGMPKSEIPLHFHDFRKLVIILQGDLFYDIEGHRYALEAGDIVLVEAGELHRPILPEDPAGIYERVIIYFDDSFFSASTHADAQLDSCFRLAAANNAPVIRGRSLPRYVHTELIPGLTRSFAGEPAARRLMEQCRLTAFLLEFNEILTARAPGFRDPVTKNPAVQRTMQYLTQHLTEPIDINTAAVGVHLDRSYLMHLFKAETGSSIMTYVTEKRLFLAQNLIRRGVPVTDACYRSGFTNYTSFYRAYRNRYGCSPREGNIERAQSIKE